ncbi:histidine triad nucleotide-binding protein [Marmoricola endophyticus]|uniref:Histidine triad nucleotide-binding protein n=1 Tax=Marmoricola endophyticus TaxID=2040280 RepID=A0A917B8W3_9ACTN|nr:histidine triad nucleotide-binding protein [Marmoricola endophyticus]GGF31737.1 histidine triad nucleotide-binding protein [Marmoricola endophyticus]
MSEPRSECLFCRIVAGEVPAEVLRTTESTVAFRDVSPQAPTHVLVVPRNHHPHAAALAQDEPETLAALVRTAHEVAADEGLGEAYRLVLNTGEAAGQSVFHVHLHLLGGRELGWPPG